MPKYYVFCHKRVQNRRLGAVRRVEQSPNVIRFFSFYNPESAIKFKFINFHEIIKLKKLNDIRGVFESISFKDFRETRKLFKNEKYGDPNYYDDDYDYMCEEDENYKSDWTRFRYINSDDYGDDWYTLEDRFIALEKKINEKKYKKTTIIKKRS